MSDAPYFEHRFALLLRSYAAAGAPKLEREAVARAVTAGVISRRTVPAKRSWPSRLAPRDGRAGPALRRWAFPQIALVGVILLATVSGFAIWSGVRNQVSSPGETPTASVAPTSSPSRQPMRSLLTLPTGVGEGWPGGLRPEPSGESVVVGTATTDAEGDVVGAGEPFVDIVNVLEGSRVESVEFRLSGAPPSPMPDPTSEQRIAYGVVIDLDADGTSDVRVGMENALAAGEELPWTMWISDLRTGESTACRCDTASLGGHLFETWYPGPWNGGRGKLWLPGAAASNARLYVWASIAEGNEVRATDYAPDAGWLNLGDPNAIPERANSDKPGPLRPEPDGGAPVVRVPRTDDPRDDTAPSTNPLADITGVTFREGCWRSLTTEACVFFNVAEVVRRPLPDPSEQWLAYGLVVDYDGDDAGDIRYGIDNVRGDRKQMWRTDLATGVTEAARPGSQEDGVMDAVYPGDEGHSPSMFIDRDAQRPFRFYVWASARDAEGNESTDFAPDFGWLEFGVER